MSSFCPNCGAPTAGERFCGSCGQALAAAEPQSPLATEPPADLEATRLSPRAHDPLAAPLDAGQTWGAPQAGEAAADSSADASAAAGDPIPAAPAEAPLVDAPQYQAPGTDQAGQQQWGAPQAPAGQWGAPQAPTDQWGAPQAPAGQWGAPQAPADQWGQPQQAAPAPQAQQQWGQPQQAPQGQQWGQPQAAQQQWGQPAQGQPGSAPWGQPGQPAQQWGAPQQQWGAPQAPAQQMQNPFKGTTVGDWARDIAALVLGFMTLGYIWTGDGAPDVPWWAIISAILTALSVVVSYVPRLGVIPVAPKAAWLVKAALNVPAVLSILAALVMELIRLTADGSDGKYGAVGLGVAVLSAAAFLAVSPRSFEASGTADALWRTLGVALLGAGCVTIVLSVIGWIVHDKPFSDTGVFGGQDGAVLVTLGLVLIVLVQVALVAVPLKSLASGRAAGAIVAGAVGLGILGSYVLISAKESVGDLAGKLISVGLPLAPGAALMFLIVAGGALALSAPVLRGGHFADSSAQWLETARLAAVTAVVGLGVWAVALVLGLVGMDQGWGGSVITRLVLAVLIGALLVGLVVTLPRAAGGALTVPVVAAAAASVLGIVYFIVLMASDQGGQGSEVLVATTVLPILATVVLTAPKSMRTDFPPLLAPKPQQPAAWGAPQAPGAPQAWGAPQSGPQQQWGQAPQQPQQWGAPAQPEQPQQWAAPAQPEQQWAAPAQPEQQWAAPAQPEQPQQWAAPAQPEQPQQPQQWGAPQPPEGQQ